MILFDPEDVVRSLKKNYEIRATHRRRASGDEQDTQKLVALS